MKAGAPRTLRQSSIASRKATRTAMDATSSMATRVESGEQPATVQKAARYAMTAGGWTLGTVECGIQAPS